MKISYNWLKEYVQKLPEPKKLADLLTNHSLEVENVNKVGNDYIFEIDVLPNRAHDCLSHIGVVREVAAITGGKIQTTKYKLQEVSRKAGDFIRVEVKDSKACPRYTARVVNNVKVGPSPKWMQEKLKAMEQKPINNIVDTANYVMFETGQPLHAFDFDKLDGKRIIVRKAKKGEKIITLDGEKCNLDTDILVIADVKSPLALAGVKGGKKAEITNKTKTIVLESANFNYKTVRATSRKTGIKTEAYLRFEHELDPNLTSQAIDRLAGLISAFGGPAAGGPKVAGDLIDVYPKKVLPKKIKLNLKKVESILGINVSKQNAIKYLKLLGFEVDDSLKVTVPTFRQDIKIEEDLIEEIARLVGYNKIPAQAPLGLLGITKLDDVLSLTNKIKTIFDGLGFTEVYNPSFIGENDLEKLGLNKKDYLEIKNPLSSDLKYLRRDLSISLLKNVKDNIKAFGKEGIKIFELGKVYLPEEKKMLTGLITGKIEKERGEKFYELKGIIDNLLNKIGITDYWYDPVENQFAVAEVKAGDEEIGRIEEINPKILSAFNIKEIIVGFNLNFEKILKLAQEELVYQPLSSYPAAVRDLAILVNQGDRVADVLNIINDVGGELVQDVDLFDMYEGEEIPNDKKNLAFHIIYQSDKKTLTDEEVDKIQRKIIRELEKIKGWQIRK